MKQLLLPGGCAPFADGDMASRNGTASGSLLESILRGCAFMNDTSVPVYVDIIDDTKPAQASDAGAVMYIIAVLVFYSAGIVTMIIKYLKREKSELEEERVLEDFFRSMPACKKEREQSNVNRVAIHAFHALTSKVSNDLEEDVTSEEETPPTIHEQDGGDDKCCASGTHVVPETARTHILLANTGTTAADSI